MKLMIKSAYYDHAIVKQKHSWIFFQLRKKTLPMKYYQPIAKFIIIIEKVVAEEVPKTSNEHRQHFEVNILNSDQFEILPRPIHFLYILITHV